MTLDPNSLSPLLDYAERQKVQGVNGISPQQPGQGIFGQAQASGGVVNGLGGLMAGGQQPTTSPPTSVSDFLNGGVANPMYNQPVNSNTGFGGFNPQRDIPIPTTPAKVNPNMGFSGFGGSGGAGGGGQSMDLGNLSVNFNPAGGNSYAKGGEVGLKAVAQELQDKGRNGDTMLAHINPQEAALLKRMGGSGTINPATGLPEYWGIKLGPVRIGSDYGGVSIGRTSIGDVLDKSGVADLIGKLGPIAPMAATYFGGPLAAGIVGGIGKGGKFNFQRALMTGALAYGAQNLAQGLGDAGTAGTAASSGTPAVADVAATLGTDVATGAGSQAAMLAEQAAGFGDAGLANIASSGSYATPSAIGLVGPAADTTAGMAEAANRTYADAARDYASNIGSKISQGASNFGSQVSNAAKGAYNLSTGAPGASEAFKASGATLTNTALPIYAGATGVMAIDEAQKMQDEYDLANAKSEAEYNEIMARIEASKQRGIDAMNRNPYQFAEGGQVPSGGTSNLADLIAQLNAITGKIKTPTTAPTTAVPALTMPAPRSTPAFEAARGASMAANPFKEMNQLRRERAAPASTPVGIGYAMDDVRSFLLGNIANDVKAGTTALKDVPEPMQNDLAAYMARKPPEFTNQSRLDFEKARNAARVATPLKDSRVASLDTNVPAPFAYGGSVDDSPGVDDYNMAKGGMPPRFLSGGGDGMSDDIPAVIGGKQPARLADGEFVIPADVVSHLGNGSSKAGAKQLYSMMDKVRAARTGNKKQGKQINPAKYMPV